MERFSRPKALECTNYNTPVGCGELNVTVGHSEGTPREVFCRLGLSGDCSRCNNEAIGRIISIGLQYGVPLEEYIQTLLGIRCSNPRPFPKDKANLSYLDAVARILKDWLDNNGKEGS